jgi:hypothetical protein
MSTHSIRTEAWLLKGITGTEPGELKLVRDRLTLKTRKGTMFDVPLSQVSKVRFPWYYFSGGLKLWIEGKSWRITFVRPNQQGGGFDSARTDEALGADLFAGADAARGFSELSRGRSAGKAWKAALAGLPRSQ